MNIYDVKLWIKLENYDEYNIVQKFLISNGYTWEKEYYYNFGIKTQSDTTSYRQRKKYSIGENTWFGINNNNIDFFHSIINVEATTTALKFIRKNKLKQIENNE